MEQGQKIRGRKTAFDPFPSREAINHFHLLALRGFGASSIFQAIIRIYLISFIRFFVCNYFQYMHLEFIVSRMPYFGMIIASKIVNFITAQYKEF